MITSIVITTYNRNPQLAVMLASIHRQQVEDLEVIVVDDGDLSHGHPSARLVCESYGARHIPCRRPPSSSFRNPAYPSNVGIRAASGGIVILQNAECKHVDPRAIEKLTALVTPANAVFARVVALNQDGSEHMLYCGEENPRPYFFCGVIRREHLVRLRGFDEDYTGAGYDDDDLADRLGASGVDFVFSNVMVHHQWHPPAGSYSSVDRMREIYQQKLGAMLRGELGVVRNVGRDWGGRP